MGIYNWVQNDRIGFFTAIFLAFDFRQSILPGGMPGPQKVDGQETLQLPDQMFHILVRACLTEKQFKFGFNRKTVVFVLCLTL